MSMAVAEADRRIEAIAQVGVITALEHGSAKARVRIGDLETHPILVSQIRSGTLRLHWMPSVGEQVVVMAPGGDLARAFILGSLPIDGNAIAPDGATPTMDLGGGTLRVVGNLFLDGDIEVTGDVTASGISLVQHTHPGVLSGGASTGEPN